eukprot:c21123_g1_i1 orf=159-1100(+)
MASLCFRSGRGLCRRGLLRCLAIPPSVCTPASSAQEASSPSRNILRPHASSSSSHFFIRAFCAPHPGGDGFQTSDKTTPADSKSEEPEAKPTADDGAGERKETKDENYQVLRHALLHVPKLGWSEAAMVEGARDVGLSPAILGVFPRKEAALVEFFMDECLQNLLDYIENQEDELTKMVLQERITKIVTCRLEMQIPYISRWAQALSIQANPANVPTSLKQRAILMDEIWHAVGDHSSDVDWYVKRGLLAAIYTATELYMLTDHSPGFRETWSFLQRRVKDAIDCRKTAQEATQLVQAIGTGFGSSLQALFRR